MVQTEDGTHGPLGILTNQVFCRGKGFEVLSKTERVIIRRGRYTYLIDVKRLQIIKIIRFEVKSDVVI